VRQVKSRRRAREVALRTLYSCEVGGSELETALAEAAEAASLAPEMVEYSSTLVHGVADHQTELDDELDGLLKKYDLMRLAALDRNILRLGAYEIAHVPYVPPLVSINEAIEIAKKYSTAESGRFINGVLGKFMENGDRSTYTDEPVVEEEPSEDPAEELIPVEEITVEEGTPEAEQAKKFGTWTVRAETPGP
jgi:N utilization substance protein B